MTSGPRFYALIYVALLCLLGATVVAARFELGVFNIVVAMIIAFAKMMLVLIYFMHLRDTNRLNAMIIGGAFVMLVIVLLGMSLGDYWSRPWLPG